MKQKFKNERFMLREDEITINHIKSLFERISEEIKKSNAVNFTDINIICEEVFCVILNCLFEKQFEVASRFCSRYPAVDLIDFNSREAFQITAQNSIEKIKYTVNKFISNKINEEIDYVKVLYLGYSNYRPKEENSIFDLENGCKFDFDTDYYTFDKLIQLIETKSLRDPECLSTIYDSITMVFESGRLSYESIVDKKAAYISKDIEVVDGHFGFDAYLFNRKNIRVFGHIPTVPQLVPSCHIEFLYHNISGTVVTLSGDDLIEKYFVPCDQFERNMVLSGGGDKDVCYVNLSGVEVELSKYSLYCLYCGLYDLSKKYFESRDAIAVRIGSEKSGFRFGKGVVFFSISRDEKDCIMNFANRIHRGKMKRKASKRDIFSYVGHNEFWIKNDDATGYYSQVRIRFEKGISSQYNVVWVPDDQIYNLDYYDNKYAWRVDYTKNWFENELYREAFGYT